MAITAGTEINGHQVDFQVNHVSSGFFETMSIPILLGRALRPNERHVAVVSESMARQAWPGEDPLGKNIFLDGHFTVVGISGSVRSVKFGESDTVQAYFPIDETNWPSLSLLVKTAGPPQSLAKPVTNAATTLDSNIFPAVDLLSTEFRANLAGAEYSVLAAGMLGLLAQLLACFGIVGVVSYVISQRMKEIGIRMALGVQRVRVLVVVLRHLSFPIGAGLIVGITVAASLSLFLRGRLYGLSNLDPGAYASALAVFVVTAAIAALLPAQRALRIDPWKALRHE